MTSLFEALLAFEANIVLREGIYGDNLGLLHVHITDLLKANQTGEMLMHRITHEWLEKFLAAHDNDEDDVVDQLIQEAKEEGSSALLLQYIAFIE